MGLILLYLIVALSISFLCSILEAVLLSTPSSFIRMKEEQGVKTATLFNKLKTNIDRPIAAILSLNTIAHTIGAAGVGAEAVKVFGDEYFGIISAILTILILVLSEIIPKTVGATYWRKLAMPSAKIINVMIIVCYPLVWLSEFITDLLASKKRENTISREEVSAMIDVGTKEGIFETKESRIMQNLIKLENIRVLEIMTPQIVTVVADEKESLREFYSDKSFRPYSRIPLYDVDRENITGYVLTKDILEKLSEDQFDMQLKDFKRSILVLPQNESISSVWESMLKNKEHIALIVNEYGSFEGIVTMEDIVETILGLEIIDEKDTVVDMQQLAREKWQERMIKYKYMSNKQS